MLKMSTAFKGLLNQIWNPCHYSVRFKTRINVQKPKPPHFTRAKVEKLCAPFYPRQISPSTPLFELCEGPNAIKEKPYNPYEHFVEKEALEYFKNNRYNFFYHLNSMSGIDYLEVLLMLNSCGVKTKKYGKKTLEKAFSGTGYEPALVLMESQTMLGFGNEVDLAGMIKGLKKTKFNLMAGIIDGRLLSVTELQNYSKLADIQTLRASFVSALGAVAGKITQQLNQHQSILVEHLKQHAKSLDEKKS